MRLRGNARPGLFERTAVVPREPVGWPGRMPLAAAVVAERTAGLQVAEPLDLQTEAEGEGDLEVERQAERSCIHRPSTAHSRGASLAEGDDIVEGLRVEEEEAVYFAADRGQGTDSPAGVETHRVEEVVVVVACARCHERWVIVNGSGRAVPVGAIARTRRTVRTRRRIHCRRRGSARPPMQIDARDSTDLGLSLDVDHSGQRIGSPDGSLDGSPGALEPDVACDLRQDAGPGVVEMVFGGVVGGRELDRSVAAAVDGGGGGDQACLRRHDQPLEGASTARLLKSNEWCPGG